MNVDVYLLILLLWRDVDMINAGIIGATGYAGAELVRLLINHNQVNIVAIVSHSYSDQKISDIYGNLRNATELLCTNLETFTESYLQKCDVVFTALPHGLTEDIAEKCDNNNVVFIDIGPDFRLTNEEDYINWYGLKFKNKEIHKKAQYGLSEIYRNEIKNSKIIGNPGCYPTSILLGLAPALKEKLIDGNSIIIDSKSGLTGAGRELSLQSHFTECNESMMAYKIGSHRHIPEIEQEISKLLGNKAIVSFTPHLLPINRGILSSIYCSLRKDVSINEIHEIYRGFYKQDKFIRVLDLGKCAEIRNVKGSNYCDISLNLDTRTNRLIIISSIDNMIKGAAGQAIQNMNLIFGLKEDTGLNLIPMVF